MTNTKKIAKKKIKVGFYGLTGCAGCLLSVIFNEDEILDLINLVDLRAFPFVKEVNISEKFDYVFMEGLVANNSDLKVLKNIRQNTKYLISLGACACTGCVPAYRHFSLKENYEHLIYKKKGPLQDIEPTPLDYHVKIDYSVPGCPPSKNEIITLIKNVIIRKKSREYQNPVCFECRKNGNKCMLDNNKLCLGPITCGGCNSVCINGGLECWGCRGPTKDMNLDLMVNILRNKGFDDKTIYDRMRTFVGLKMEMLERVLSGKINNP